MNKSDRPKIPFLVFLDEMASYSTETLTIMFEQARSARVSLWPAIQTDSGLSNISEDFKERVMSNTETKIFFKLSSQETSETASNSIGMTKRIISSETASQGTSASAQAMTIGPNKNLSDSSTTASGEREQEEPLVHPDQIKALQPGECIILRSPRVWNIRVPMLDLDPSIKQAIGPLRINHRFSPIHKDRTFNAMGRVDDYIKEAQRLRAQRPKKDKNGNRNTDAPRTIDSRAEAGATTVEDIAATVGDDMPTET